MINKIITFTYFLCFYQLRERNREGKKVNTEVGEDTFTETSRPTDTQKTKIVKLKKKEKKGLATHK